MIYVNAAKMIADRNRQEGEEIGITNGCFDLFHAGHVNFLRSCASQCSFLLVGINTDRSVQKLKGSGKPIMGENDRLAVVQSCRYVGQAFLFPELRFDSCITEIRPHVWFKGSDYSLETLDAQELAAAKACETAIVIIPEIVPVRTSSIIDRIIATSCPKG